MAPHRFLELSHFTAPETFQGRDKRVFLRDQWKEIEENNRMERLEISTLITSKLKKIINNKN